MRNLLLLLLLSFPVFAQQGVWGERGISRRFVLRGDLLYAADGRGVSVYDVSNPANIRRIDVESGDAESRDLAFIGTTDLVLATDRGIDRFAVAADGTLTRLGTTAVTGGVTRIAGTPTRAVAAAGQTLLILSRTEDALAVEYSERFNETIRALAANGNTIYAAVQRSAIFAIDANSGTWLNTIAVNAVGLAISGSTMWAAAEIRGLFAIDLATGTVVGVTGAGQMTLTDVAAAGTRVYATEAPDRVHVFDGGRREAPVRVATLTDWVTVIAASGNRLFLSGQLVDDETFTFETGVPVRVYDFTTTTAPVQVGEFRDLAGPVSGVWTDGSIAYVVDQPFLRVIDVSTTAAPRELGSIVVPEIQDHIRVKNGLAINYGRVRVNLIDVSSPRRPKVIGSWHTQGHAPSHAALSRDTFVEANEHSGLHVVDYSNPAEPVQIAGRIFHYLDIAAGDDAIYTIQQTTFLTIDLTDRRRVVDRTVYSGQHFQLDTTPPNAAFPHHVVLRTAQAVMVYSLENDRFTPRLTKTVPMASPGLFGTNETSVFVTKDGVLHRMNVAGPGGFSATDMAVTAPQQISVAGEKVVIADRYRLRIYGPDTPAPPAEPGKKRAVRR